MITNSSVSSSTLLPLCLGSFSKAAHSSPYCHSKANLCSQTFLFLNQKATALGLPLKETTLCHCS